MSCSECHDTKFVPSAEGIAKCEKCAYFHLTITWDGSLDAAGNKVGPNGDSKLSVEFMAVKNGEVKLHEFSPGELNSITRDSNKSGCMWQAIQILASELGKVRRQLGQTQDALSMLREKLGR